MTEGTSLLYNGLVDDEFVQNIVGVLEEDVVGGGNSECRQHRYTSVSEEVGKVDEAGCVRHRRQHHVESVSFVHGRVDFVVCRS